ncbi:MAG: dihydroxyacetone kinase subunit L [Chloroflexota bacterium]|nr:MAG: dihydroxyacetone kinase subunit L [Chloroflexota bacterium]
MTLDTNKVIAWIEESARVINQNRDYLTSLDAAIGDADHGANMDRGFKAVVAKLKAAPPQDIGAALKTVGMTLISTVGGAGGPLYGTFFLQAGTALGGKTELTLDDLAAALEAAVNGVKARGKAVPGDKTMIDALEPAVKAIQEAREAKQSIAEALKRTVEAARKGMEATIPLVARKGRASYLGERSAGHQDPGATSSVLLLQAAADTWTDHE